MSIASGSPNAEDSSVRSECTVSVWPKIHEKLADVLKVSRRLVSCLSQSSQLAKALLASRSGSLQVRVAISRRIPSEFSGLHFPSSQLHRWQRFEYRLYSWSGLLPRILQEWQSLRLASPSGPFCLRFGTVEQPLLQLQIVSEVTTGPVNLS